MILTVQKYNSLEKEGRIHLPNRFIEAFQPVAFETMGYPSRIENEMEVYKFIDSMHEGRLKRYYKNEIYNYAPTYEEFDHIKEISEKIYHFSKNKYGRGIVVKASMLSSMNVFRRIKLLSFTEKRPTIFEIGGGNGILGALLHKAEYRYFSTDISQAFYLTQNNVWEGLFPDCVEEYIDSIENLNMVSSQKMTHIPYWKLWELRNSDLEADIIVANHCLTEMNPRSLCFYLQYGRQLMRNSQYGLVVVQSMGYPYSGDVKYLLQSFDEMGYALIYSEQDFAVFSLKEKLKGPAVDMKELLQKCTLGHIFPICINSASKIGELLERANQRMLEVEKVSFKEIEEFFSSLDKNTNSPDEEFIEYCDKKADTTEDRNITVYGATNAVFQGVKESELLKFFLKNKGKSIATYGVGHNSNFIFNLLFKNDMEDYIKILFDSDISRAGTNYRGYNICYPTKQKLKKADIILITSTRYSEEIEAFLLGQGIEQASIYKITEFLV